MIEMSRQSNNTNMSISAAQIMIKDNQIGTLKPTTKLNPSELLHGVTTRFDSDDDGIAKEEQDTKNKANARRTEELVFWCEIHVPPIEESSCVAFLD